MVRRPVLVRMPLLVGMVLHVAAGPVRVRAVLPVRPERLPAMRALPAVCEALSVVLCVPLVGLVAHVGRVMGLDPVPRLAGRLKPLHGLQVPQVVRGPVPVLCRSMAGTALRLRARVPQVV
jgi:hypothetical protein